MISDELLGRLHALERCLSGPLAHFQSGPLSCCWVVGALCLFWTLDPLQIHDSEEAGQKAVVK